MKFHFVALMCVFMFSSAAFALAPVEAEPAPFDTLLSEMTAHKVALTPELRAEAAELVSSLSESERELLLTDWSDEEASSVHLKDIIVLAQLPQSRAFCAKLTHHDDDMVRFMALVAITAGGDDKAAEQVHALIHDPAVDDKQARWVRATCEAIGMDIKEETPESIAKHLRVMIGDEPLLKPGDPAPLFEVTDMQGEKLKLQDMKGKVVVLHFWATWCGPCMGELPHLKTQLEQLDPQVVVIGVSLDDDREKLVETLKKYEMPWHNVYDGRGWGSELGRLYGINAVPTNAIIDREGVYRSNKISDVSKLLSNFEEADESSNESPDEPASQP